MAAIRRLPCAPSTSRVAAALRPLRQSASRPATSPVVCATVEERGGAISLLHRTEEYGGGGSARYQRDETEGAQCRATAFGGEA